MRLAAARMTETSDGKRDFFVSFNRADQAWADWIAWTLEEAGYSVWYQRWDFAGNFVRDMDQAHDGSRRTLGFLSPDSLASANVRNEWDARRAEDPGHEHDRLLLVRVRPCDPPGLLKPFVWLDVADLPEAEAKQLILARVGGLRRKPPEPPPFPSPGHEAVTEKPRFPVPDHNLPRAAGPFVGRADELADLGQALAKGGRAAITQPHAITGLGGVGKTTLALRYAYAHLADYDLVRWLPAEEPATLAAAFTTLAAPLGLDPATPDQPALVAAIRARLERTPRWLLVFDNATDPASLDPYLPRLGTGHVLVTSRRQDWGEAAGTLELDVLPEAEAVALLLGDAPADEAAREQAVALAAELGHLPLALAQARAFTRARGLAVAASRAQLAAARPKVLAWRRPAAPYTLPVAEVWQASV